MLKLNKDLWDAKVQGNLSFSKLTLAEKRAIDFYIESGDDETESDGEEKTFDRPIFASISTMANAQAEADQRIKCSRINGQVKAMSHISPTSNIVERLFSNAKLIMTDQRRCMDPTTLETILMLKLNKDLWDARDIEMLRRRAADERATERRLNFPTPSSTASAAQLSSSSSSSVQQESTPRRQRFDDDNDDDDDM